MSKSVDSGDKVVAGCGSHMQSIATIDKDGTIHLKTHTFTHCKMAGFTGGTRALFSDNSGKVLYQTPTESYGVDGELIPFKDSDRWDEKVYHVDPSIYNNTYRIDVLVFHNPHNRLLKDIQIIAEIAKAVYELYQKVFGSSGDTAGTGDNGDYTFDAGNDSYLYGTYKQNLTTSVKPVGTFTSLQTINGNYLTVVNGGGKLTDVIHSDATAIGSWEKFKLVPISGNQYALQTINGNYLTVVNGGGKLTDVIHSDATAIGPWEKFKLVPISGNQYALQTINGNYLTVVGGGGKLTDVIHSDATAIGPWEKFKLVPLNGYLNGYSIPTGVFGLDHTYVTSDNPSFSWECWGRESGGKMICRGDGNPLVANCISQSNSHAGIIYGVTGVCHQTANRILYPAGVTVSKAGGYRASNLAYGTYGTTAVEFFARLEICKASLSTHALKSEVPIQPLEMDMNVQSHSKDDLEKAYIQKIVAIYTGQMQTSHINSKIMNEESSPLQERGLKSFNSTIMNKKNSSLLGKELELMMELRLGGNLDFQITQPVLKQQSDFLREKGKMDGEFYSADLSIEKYVKEVNDLFGDLLISLPDILGDDNYKKIFDLIPSKDRFVLIDPDIAVKVHKRR